VLVRDGRLLAGLRLPTHRCACWCACLCPLAAACRDIGGQRQYRSEWGRYTKGCDVIIFVVDAFAVRRSWRVDAAIPLLTCRCVCLLRLQREQIPVARKELHRLLENRCVLLRCRGRHPLRRCSRPTCEVAHLWSVCVGALARCRDLATTPLLICLNKIDLEPHISEPELIRGKHCLCCR
jgi:ADP-ribosylation factor-like protein 8